MDLGDPEMTSLIFSDIIGIAIGLAFVLWIWWVVRLQEIARYGDMSRLSKLIHRQHGFELKRRPDEESGTPTKYWRWMVASMFVVPIMWYLLDNTRPLPFVGRLLVTVGTILIFALCVYYLDHKLAK